MLPTSDQQSGLGVEALHFTPHFTNGPGWPASVSEAITAGKWGYVQLQRQTVLGSFLRVGRRGLSRFVLQGEALDRLVKGDINLEMEGAFLWESF